MTWRWITASAGALVLASLTVPVFFGFDIPMARSLGTNDVTGATCDPDARPSDLSFTLQDMNGDEVKLSSYEGKVILLNFWATWCGPCKVEIPGFVELQEEYGDEGLVVLGLSVDDPIEKLKPFAEEYQINYPILVGLGRHDVQDSFGPVWGIPVTFYIARDGTLCKTHTGLVTKEQAAREIRALL